MKIDNKVKLCLCLLFMACLVLVSVGSACASDSVSVSNFTAMNKSISNGENVSLANDIVIKASENLSDGIVINRSTTVDGCGHFIDANGTGRFFQITNGSAVLTLKNITLKNGKADNGGAIYSNDNVNLKCENNVIFNNNTATHFATVCGGGAIYSNGNVTITCTNGDVNMNNNTANSDGGAIRSSGSVTITCTNGSVWMNNNNARNSGGVICSYGGSVTITADNGLSMNNNTASWAGGAIDSNGNVTITCTNGDVNMNNNTANSDGGAIRALGEVTINVKDDILFEYNYANRTGEFDIGGGAISAYMYDGENFTYYNVTITSLKGNIQFNNNIVSVGGNGGAIFGDNVNIGF